MIMDSLDWLFAWRTAQQLPEGELIMARRGRETAIGERVGPSFVVQRERGCVTFPAAAIERWTPLADFEGDPHAYA